MSKRRVHTRLLMLFLLASLALASQNSDSGSLETSGPPPKVHNRQLSSVTDAGRMALRFDERPGSGIAWWPDSKLADGTIEFDVRGKNAPQQSFVGIAFHGADETTYDVVYFRPFNFRATDALARSHAVQYISLPGYDWQKLRSEHTGEYEKAIAAPPDPDAWFHVRIVIAHPQISAFVNGSSEPSLVVKQLNERTAGWVGLWVGNGSGGDFANLKITPAR